MAPVDDATTQAPATISAVVVAARLVKQARQQAPGQPKMFVYSGRTGAGKTMALAAIALRHQAIYLRLTSAFTPLSFLTHLLSEAGLPPERTVQANLDALVAELRASGRAVVLDEFDFFAERERMRELVRDLHDLADVPIVLVGEERLQQRLRQHQRFHDRVYRWERAPRATLDDARKLAQFYCPQLELGEDLLEKLNAESDGVVRRLSTALSHLHDFAGREGLRALDLRTWLARSHADTSAESAARRVA